jgi:hypothetical protein
MLKIPNLSPNARYAAATAVGVGVQAAMTAGAVAATWVGVKKAADGNPLTLQQQQPPTQAGSSGPVQPLSASKPPNALGVTPFTP